MFKQYLSLHRKNRNFPPAHWFASENLFVFSFSFGNERHNFWRRPALVERVVQGVRAAPHGDAQRKAPFVVHRGAR